MPTDSGYSNQKKKGLAQFETIHDLGSDSYGKNVAIKALYDKVPGLSVLSIVDILGPDGQVKYWNIQTAAHSAIVGDVIRFTVGSSLENFQFSVEKVLDATHFYVLPVSPTAPIVGDILDVMGYVSQKLSSMGETSVSITTPPTQFNYDGAPQTVEQDTAAVANNRAMPNLLFIYKDGVQVPIVKDTGLPSNTVGIPVEIVAASGTPINITAGDLNVQLSDQGVNFDSSRLGDGSGIYLKINADGSINVVDAAAVAALQSLDSKSPALVGGKVPVDTGLAQPLTDTQLRATAVPVSGTIAVSNFPATQPVSGSVSVSNFPATQPISAASLPLPTGAATETTLLANGVLVGAVNETAPATDIASSGLNGRLQRIAQRITSLIALIPASLGQKTMANSFAVTLASDQTAIPSTQTALTASYQEDVTVTVAVETITAPAGAKWCKIMTECTGGDMRVKIGGTASAASGFKFQDGRSEDFQSAGNISYCMEAGTGKIYVQFGA